MKLGIVYKNPSMKKIYTTIIASLLLVTNYATDIYVNNSGQAGTYTTIAAAISAASSGDRIFISPYGVYTENLTVNKSLTFASAVSGTNFNVLGSFSVTADAGMDVRIIGGIFSSSLNATTNTATQNNMTDIYVIDSEFYTVNLNDDFVRAHVLFCSNMGTVNIQNGEIIGCSINQTQNSSVTISDGPNIVTGDTVKIIGNLISRYLSFQSDDNYYVIANNSIGMQNEEDMDNVGSTSNSVNFSGNAYNSNINNLFINNFVVGQVSSTTYAVIYFESTPNFSNVLLKNNVIIPKHAISQANNYSYAAIRYNGTASNSPLVSYNLIVGYTTGITSTQNTQLFDIDQTDFWINRTTYIDSLGRCSNSNYCIGKGTPSIDHYDIDMTINDRGTYGGPYSIDNYINTTNGKARIYDLDIPFEIWSGQTPTVKAKGAHTK